MLVLFKRLFQELKGRNLTDSNSPLPSSGQGIHHCFLGQDSIYVCSIYTFWSTTLSVQELFSYIILQGSRESSPSYHSLSFFSPSFGCTDSQRFLWKLEVAWLLMTSISWLNSDGFLLLWSLKVSSLTYFIPVTES